MIQLEVIDKIFLLSTSSQMRATALLAGGPFVPANPRRIALVFCAPQANRVTLSLDNPPVLDVGLTLYPGQLPTSINVKDHGDLVRREWHAASAVADQVLVYYEVLSGLG